MTTGSGVHVFFFLCPSPPIGDLRWKHLNLQKKWTGIKDCLLDPVPCNPPGALLCFWSKSFVPETPISEDCLYLNVWSGQNHGMKKTGADVYLWWRIQDRVDRDVPSMMVKIYRRKGVVFVSINYRVGIFGFLSHPWIISWKAHIQDIQ